MPAVNRAYSHVTGTTEDEFIAQPQRVIRHPEIPRSVFNLGQYTLELDRGIFARTIKSRFRSLATNTGDSLLERRASTYPEIPRAATRSRRTRRYRH
jgi:hypothetical protein